MSTDDHALAAELATAAGRLLLALRTERGFADSQALKDAGDLKAHEFLTVELAARRPGDAVLSEEGKDDLARLTADRVWIVDPLDGTREYGEAGRTDWAVHVALWADGRLAAGAVALPAQGRTLTTLPDGTAADLATPAQTHTSEPVPGGAATVTEGGTLPVGAAADLATPVQARTSEPVPGGAATGTEGGAVGAVSDGGVGDIAGARGLRIPVPGGERVRIAVSRSRPPGFVQRLAERLPVEVELVPIGSAGAKIAAVLLGEVDAYVHGGGQYEWDNAAPAAVVLAAGGHASRIDGSPLSYNHEHPELPDILVCHPRLAPMLLAGIRDVTDDQPV